MPDIKCKRCGSYNNIREVVTRCLQCNQNLFNQKTENMTKTEQSIHNDICEFLKPFNLKIDDVSGQLWNTYKSNNMYIRRCMFHFLHYNKKYSYRQIGKAIGIHHSMVAHNISMFMKNEEKKKDNILSYDQQRRMFNYLKIF